MAREEQEDINVVSENQIFFDLFESPSLIINKDRIEQGLDHLKFENILQYVALPRFRLEEQPVSTKLKPNKGIKQQRVGLSDRAFLFKFLHRKKVDRIIHLIVEDRTHGLEPAHSDEVIELAVGRFKVEVWDWRKIDICSGTIVNAAPYARVVHLYLSGNNAVLRGWGKEGGLNQLRKLEVEELHAEKGLETIQRTQNNINYFTKQLIRLRPKVEVIVKNLKTQKLGTRLQTGGAAETSHEKFEHRHKWLTCMYEFADFIQDVEPPDGFALKPITVALIDDGVDITEMPLQEKIIGGRSFCRRGENFSTPYYVTSGGHGTAMAELICHVFPRARLYIFKLDEHTTESNKRQITAESAAKAVWAACDKNVDIISMSWTIEKTPGNAEDIAKLDAAIEAAAKKNIIMMCAASDQGIESNKSYPAAGRINKLFKIGAAQASGTMWEWVGDPNAVDFIFPGHNVVMDRPREMRRIASLEKCKTVTGSSVATALAAGLAGLILYCVQIGALNTQASNQAGGVTMDDYHAMKCHERMRDAFMQIGENNKFVEVWNAFETASKKAKAGVGNAEIVSELAKRLKQTKTYA